MKLIAGFLILASMSVAHACDANKVLNGTVQSLLRKESQKLVEQGFPEQLEDDGGLIQTIMTVDPKTSRYTSWRILVTNSCEASYEQF